MPVRNCVARPSLWLLTLCVAVPVGGEELTFERHIRPILKVHCLDCHGATDELKGGLDLRLQRSMARGGDSGAAMVPGDPDASYLLQRIQKGEMPPGDVKVSADEIATLKRWIAAGAPTARPEPESLPPGLSITPEEREFWSFQPLRRPPVPSVAQGERVRTPIDAFLLAELEPRGLSFSPEASKDTLVRRAYLDLLGLPPTQEQIQSFVDDSTPDAWERLIDRLLSSPHYGERWARHWLDVAGYADSEGDTGSDRPRPFAYKYRDYVINAFNNDKPLDHFIQEQLAGDELVSTPHDDLSPGDHERLIATGFLRMAADQTVTDGSDTAKNQVVADTIKIVSTSLLGLSVGCAQCHDHRYDPIPHADYYRIRAVFEPALDWQNWRHADSRRISLYTAEDRAKASAIEKQVVEIENERIQNREKFIAEALEAEIERLPEPVREPLRQAHKTPSEKRSAEQKKLIETYPSTKINGGNLYQYNSKAAAELSKAGEKIAELRKKKPFEDFLRVLTEVPGQVPDTHRFHRGDHQQPKEKVAPGVLTIATRNAQPYELPANDPSIATTGRRLAYARWLTTGTHPLVGRVLVNRIWLHHFGLGIVSTPSDFGKLGTEPSHPVLLDWLAAELARGGWSLKKLHKLIMTSTVYKQSARRDSKQDAIDPDNRLHWRRSVVRLAAEAVRDRMLFTTGELDQRLFGRPVSVTDHETGQIVIRSPRRSVYVEVRRTKPVAVLKTFDLPVMQTNCDQRASSTVAPQALLLMNSDFILERAAAFAKRLRRETTKDDSELVPFTEESRLPRLRRQLSLAWRLAYSRAASDEELDTALAFLQEQLPALEARAERQREAEEKAAAAKKDEKAKDKENGKDQKPKPLDPELQALANVCQALLSSNEFLYVD